MSYRLSKIYTRTGDDGYTQLGDGQRLLKNALRIETLGTIDELNSALGVVMSISTMTAAMLAIFSQIQQHLFDVGGELCPPYHPVITAENITKLEQQIDQWNKELPPLTEFILPGGHPITAFCHVARAVCRRAERCLIALHQAERVRLEIRQYLNRLSDVLFVAARILAKEHNASEVLWHHERKKT